MSIPGVNEAIREGSQGTTLKEIQDLAGRFRAASAALAEAQRALR